jgi:hypothetical protein
VCVIRTYDNVVYTTRSIHPLRGTVNGDHVPSTRAIEHRTGRLQAAKQLLTAAKPEDLKVSVAASREACELLRDR